MTIVEYVSSVASKTVVTTSGSPTFVGQPVTFTATVTPVHGTIPDGELVRFFTGTTLLGSVPLLQERAALTTSFLPARSQYIKATYEGDTEFKPTSGWIQQVVEKYPTTTTVTSNANPAQLGESITFTAHVTSSGPVPAGTVRFSDGLLPLGLATLNGGVAELTRSTLAVSTHTITAKYLGNAVSGQSISPVLKQVVQ